MMLLYLDAGLPRGVLDSVESERLWESYLARFGEKAWARWDERRWAQEGIHNRPESISGPLCYSPIAYPQKIDPRGIYGPLKGMSGTDPRSPSDEGRETCRP